MNTKGIRGIWDKLPNIFSFGKRDTIPAGEEQTAPPEQPSAEIQKRLLASVLGRGITAFRGLAGLMLPESCAACANPDVSADGLCENCNIRLLNLVALPYCPRCGATLGPNITPWDDGCKLCPTPLPRFSRLFRLGPYAGPLRLGIQRVKYHREEALRHHLGTLLANVVSAGQNPAPPQVVLPVPMHWWRRLSRGYDHAGMLARTLARQLNLPLGDELVRIRHTPPQPGLSRKARVENVRGAFGLTATAGIRGARVLLVDDVTTTGATADEAVRTLLEGGASDVRLAVLAKADPPRAYSDRKDSI